MDRIASFTINHLDLMPGLYVSRRDAKGDCVTTTFDLRITAPNREPGETGRSYKGCADICNIFRIGTRWNDSASGQ